MKYRDFGNTGLKISEIVFGAGGVGGLVFRPERATRLEAVRRALELGINWIDTRGHFMFTRAHQKNEEKVVSILEEEIEQALP